MTRTDHYSKSKIKVLFADPIGHVLGFHDREICDHLSCLGLKVMLVTNEDYPYDGSAGPYPVARAFRGVIGGASMVAKGINYLSSLFSLFQEVNRFRPNLVIYYYVMQPALDRFLFSLLRLRKHKTILAVHDVTPFVSEVMVSKAYCRLYQSVPEILTFGAYARNELVTKYGIDSAKVHNIFLAVECPPETGIDEKNLARTRLGLAMDAPIILCFGQIKQNKGLEYLLQGFSMVTKEFPEARLIVAGRPWKVDMTPFLDLAGRLGIMNQTVFRSEFIPEEDAREYMIAADLLVLPYTRLYQSAVLPFACSYGRPVVATTVGSITEIIEDGNTGYLVPPCNAVALGKAMLEALRDPSEAKRRGNNAREIMKQRYSWNEFGNRLAEIIQTIS